MLSPGICSGFGSSTVGASVTTPIRTLRAPVVIPSLSRVLLLGLGRSSILRLVGFRLLRGLARLARIGSLATFSLSRVLLLVPGRSSILGLVGSRLSRGFARLARFDCLSSFLAPFLAPLSSLLGYLSTLPSLASFAAFLSTFGLGSLHRLRTFAAFCLSSFGIQSLLRLSALSALGSSAFSFGNGVSVGVSVGFSTPRSLDCLGVFALLPSFAVLSSNSSSPAGLSSNSSRLAGLSSNSSSPATLSSYSSGLASLGAPLRALCALLRVASVGGFDSLGIFHRLSAISWVSAVGTRLSDTVGSLFSLVGLGGGDSPSLLSTLCLSWAFCSWSFCSQGVLCRRLLCEVIGWEIALISFGKIVSGLWKQLGQKQTWYDQTGDARDHLVSMLVCRGIARKERQRRDMNRHWHVS